MREFILKIHFNTHLFSSAQNFCDEIFIDFLLAGRFQVGKYLEPWIEGSALLKEVLKPRVTVSVL